MFAEDISEDFSEDRRCHFYWILEYSGYLRNPRRRLLSSEQFSEVSTLLVFTLKPVPANLSVSGHLRGHLSGSAVESFL